MLLARNLGRRERGEGGSRSSRQIIQKGRWRNDRAHKAVGCSRKFEWERRPLNWMEKYHLHMWDIRKIVCFELLHDRVSLVLSSQSKSFGPRGNPETPPRRSLLPLHRRRRQQQRQDQRHQPRLLLHVRRPQGQANSQINSIGLSSFPIECRPCQELRGGPAKTLIPRPLAPPSDREWESRKIRGGRGAKPHHGHRPRQW